MYKLTVKNFKCFTDCSIQIDNSLVLFDGPSGIGKSSLIQAFIFSITGEGKKLYKQGTKSLSVELEFEYNDSTCKITRKKGPESLVFTIDDKKYEDDEAQTHVNNIFGKNFLLTSIIKQKGESSFLSSSSKDKMAFLQSLLFSDTDIDDKKKKIKRKLVEHRDNLTKLEGQKIAYDTLLSSEKTFSQNIISLYSDESSCKENIETLLSKIKNTTEQINDNNIKTTKLTKLRQEYKQQQYDLKEKCQKYETLSRQIDEINEELLKYTYKLEEEDVEEIQKELVIIRNKIKYKKLYVKIEDVLSALSNKCSKELEEIKPKLGNTIDEEYYNKCVEKRDLLKKLKVATKGLNDNKTDEDLTLLESKIESYQIYLDAVVLYKTSLKCPHCNHFVKFYKNNLEKVDIKSDTRYDDKTVEEKKDSLKILKEQYNEISGKQKLFNHYKQEVENLEKKIENYQDINLMPEELVKMINNIDEQRIVLKELEKKNRLLEKEITDIKNKSHSSVTNDVSELKKIEKLVEIPINKSLDELQNEYSSLLVKEKEREQVKEKVDELSNKKRQLSRDLKNLGITKNNFEEDTELLNNKILNLDEELLEISSSLNQLNSVNIQELLDRVELNKQRIYYLEYINERNKKQDEKLKIEEDYKKEEKTIVNLSIISTGLEYAESKMLAKFIDTINHNLSVHLDAFFSEPMSVVIKPFNENDKPVINMEIYYKGNEVDVSSLSGGEYDRLNLALTMTFNELSNSKILILDESLSSINQELSTDIIMHIKENYDGKLIWMTQHQAVKGMFDFVIDVQKL